MIQTKRKGIANAYAADEILFICTFFDENWKNMSILRLIVSKHKICSLVWKSNKIYP